MTTYYRGSNGGNYKYWDSTQTTPPGVTDIIIIGKNPATGLTKEIQYNSDDVEVSVLTFSSEDIMYHAVTTSTSVTAGTLISLKSDAFVNKMIQIENLI